MRKKISMQDVEQNLSDDEEKSRGSSQNDLSGVGTGNTGNRNRLTVGSTNSNSDHGRDRNSTPSPNMRFNKNNRTALATSKVDDYNMREIGGGNVNFSDDPRQMTREQLMDMVQRQRDELDYKESQVTHLEQYVDTLLVKIISCNPELLNSDFAPTSRDAHNKLEERHSLDMQRRNNSNMGGDANTRGGQMKNRKWR